MIARGTLGRRILFRTLGMGTLTVVLSLIPGLTGPALAQVDASAHFRTQLGTERISALALSAVEQRYGWLVGLLYGYSRSPVRGEHAGLVGTRNLVSDHHFAEVRTVLGLPFVEVGFALPFVINQKGERWFDLSGEPQPSVRPYALGDLRLHAKGMLVNPRRYGLGLGLAATLTTPTGQVDRYAGNRGVVLDGRVILDVWISRTVTFAMNLGYVFRSAEERLEALVIDDALHMGLGFLFSFNDLGLPLHLWAEVVASSQVRDLFRSVKKSPVEGRFGVRFWNSDRFFVDVGWGVALVRGAGLPIYRVLVDLGFTFQTPGRGRTHTSESDRDGDGIPDAVDACPDEAEDYDGLEDADGCPEKEGPDISERDRDVYQRGAATPWWQRWRWKRDRDRKREKELQRKRDLQRKHDLQPKGRESPRQTGEVGPERVAPREPPPRPRGGSQARLPDLKPQTRSIKDRSKRLGKTFDRIRKRLRHTEEAFREAKQGVKDAVPRREPPPARTAPKER